MDQRGLRRILSELGGIQIFDFCQDGTRHASKISWPRDLTSLSKGACDPLNRVLDMTQLTKGASYTPPVCKKASELPLQPKIASNMSPPTKWASGYSTLLKQASNIFSLNEKTSNFFLRELYSFFHHGGLRIPTTVRENLRPSSSHQSLWKCQRYHLCPRGLQIDSTKGALDLSHLPKGTLSLFPLSKPNTFMFCLRKTYEHSLLTKETSDSPFLHKGVVMGGAETCPSDDVGYWPGPVTQVISDLHSLLMGASDIPHKTKEA